MGDVDFWNLLMKSIKSKGDSETFDYYKSVLDNKRGLIDGCLNRSNTSCDLTEIDSLYKGVLFHIEEYFSLQKEFRIFCEEVIKKTKK